MREIVLAKLKLFQDEIEMLNERLVRALERNEPKLVQHLDVLRINRRQQLWSYRTLNFQILYGGRNPCAEIPMN